MSSWIQDTAVQAHNGAGFSSTTGPVFDPATYNQQLQRMQNGAMRNGSPASFNNSSSSSSNNNPVYQTNSLVPSKRAREDNTMGTSPRPGPGILPHSRSQTPQQNTFPGFPQAQSVPQQPYSHLQNGSVNASPSPVMGNQLRPGSVPQRVSTASPHPFSPAAQQFPHPSPSQSEYGGSRVDTPQQSNSQFAPNTGFASSFNQNYTPPPGRSSVPPQGGTPHIQSSHIQLQHPQQQQQQQQQQQHPHQRIQNPADQQRLLYQMQLQQQFQQRNILGQRSNVPPNANPMATPHIPGPNEQYAGPRPPHIIPQTRNTPNPESFMKTLVSFMNVQKLPLEMTPVVGNRIIPLPNLYSTVARFGGYKKLMATNGWGQVAVTLQLHPMEHQAAPQQLKGIYERNLLMFDEAWQTQQRGRQMMQQNPNIPGPHMSPTKQMNHQAAAMQQQTPSFVQQQLMGQHLQQQQQQQQTHTTPVKQMQPIHHGQQPSVNGFSTPQPPQNQPHPAGSQSQSRNSLSQSIDATPPQNGIFPTLSPMSGTKPGILSLPSPQIDQRASAPPDTHEFNLPSELDPKARVLDTFGGVELESLGRLGAELTRYKPDIPAVGDLGVIDMHALTMSLQSGIHSEVRLALDTLVSLSIEHRVQVDLGACEDLVETLVDCAELQVELLAENAAEVSDVMLVNSYEDVLRGCRYEQEVLQEIPAFGSLEYELDRAVDRLICITTIMRNFSFYEVNHPLLADELVIKFLSIVIRYLGTRNMLLRTNLNTLDFLKDVIIFLSNLAQAIELPGREQALCLLQFLLAFAPCPTPNGTNSEAVTFSPYDPAIHLYLPAAVDSLAKLLARDHPNRTYYKTIFSSDGTSAPAFDLLTRTFALAVSAVPDDKHDAKRTNVSPVVEARKPFLMQGMLAAEILSNLVPGYETGIARSWLASEDGFSQKLCRLIVNLCLEATPHIPHRQSAMAKGVEDEALLHITLGGIAVLHQLAEKSRDPEDPSSAILLSGIPAKESLLAGLNIVQPRLQGVLKHLCAYAGLVS